MPFVLMVAGPNGSGKTTLTQHLRDQGVDLGLYINPDEIAASLIGSYDDRVRTAQSIADEQRAQALAARISFTFETVMSHPSKVDFFETCQAAGFEAILYFVATRDPRLNVARVAQRVALGGHDVPADRIVSRYERSLELLPRALRVATRGAVFDNSDAEGLTLGLLKSSGGGYETAPHASGWIAGLRKRMRS
jgi:predicted ABC-type ATPase